ncbi:MAG: CDP-alcohol phosphatidyltransferase family protein [Vicinamibacterales bacterium]
MLDDPVRAILPKVVGGLARRLGRAGVTPNMMSVASWFVAIAAAVLVARGYPILGVLVWLLSRLGDGLDGLIARQSGSVSPFGGYLDITLDMAAYGIMVIGFAMAYPALGLAWSAILLSYILSITSTLALSNAASATGRQVSRTDRTFQFTSSLAEAGETSIMYSAWAVFPQWMEPLAWTWCAVVLVSVVQRSWLAYRVLSENGPSGP